MKAESTPGTDQPAWLSDDRRCVWHPYTQMLTAPAPVPVERAEGVYLYTPDGRRVLDGISSWWVNIHGHNHPRLNRALKDQSERLAQVIFAGFTHEPASRLAAELVERTPSNLTRVFFSDDGSTAVEAALKMACQYWQNQGETGRDLFVALEHSYHGDTFGAMAVGGIGVFHSRFSRFLFQVRHASLPPGSLPSGERTRLTGPPPLEEILEREGERVAAVIVEPLVQAAGGMLIWPAGFLRRIRELTRERRIPLIADEVFTGFGRTGCMFACQHAGVEPDIICLSKALTGGYLPLAATLASEEIYQAFLSHDHSRTFFHGHSYTGNALACAVARENLSLFDENGSLGRVRELQQLFEERLDRLKEAPAVVEVRGIGALAVVELKPEGKGGYLDQRGTAVARTLFERGILLRPLGNVLYFLPPYVITDEEAHRVFDVLEEVLQEA